MAQRGRDRPQPFIGRRHRARARVGPVAVLPEQRPSADLEAAHGFLQRRLEAAVDRHHLARRLHLRADLAVAEGELVERPARDFDHAVVQRRLERRRRALRHRVGYLVQPFADRDLGRDARDRVARRLRCQRRAARHARVDLDDVVGRRVEAVARLRLRTVRPGPRHDVGTRRQCELNIAAAFDAQGADDL